MGLFEFLFGSPTVAEPAPPAAPVVPRAVEIMRAANPHALIAYEDYFVVMIEDVRDPDGRLFRIEIQSTLDGQHAIARVRYSPWGSTSDAHCLNGVICLGLNGHGSNLANSPYALDVVIPRARFWCTACSVYHESGVFPSP